MQGPVLHILYMLPHFFVTITIITAMTKDKKTEGERH